MGNIIDYVALNREPFEEKPFCTSDAMVFAQLSYMDYAGFVQGMKRFSKAICLKDILKHPHWERLACIGDYLDLKKELFRQAATSPRFENVRLKYYVDEYDEAAQMQFSAVTFLIGDMSAVAAFRGTDSTVVGWKEDFDMVFKDEIPAQTAAVNYINKLASFTNGDIISLGHSKGGNLAVYSCVKCRKNVQKRVSRIYNFDGPGFKDDIYLLPEYAAVDSKITTVIPQSSIVGLLLRQRNDYKIVQSNAVGFSQHNMFSWQFENGRIVRLAALQKDAVIMDRILDDWVDKMSMEERRRFVDTIYSVVMRAGVVTVNDMKAHWKDIASFAKDAMTGMDDETKSFFKNTVILFFDAAKLNLKGNSKGELGIYLEGMQTKALELYKSIKKG